MQAFHKQLIGPSGASHALSVRLTPLGDSATVDVISHLITARDSLLQVWEVRERSDGTSISAKLSHLLTRRLHGSITHLARVRTLASKVDGADRVLISFKDAKMSLMEWTPAAHDLLPVSLHTFEKIPQVAEGLALSATDPSSRLSVLLLPTNTGGDGTLAILPFFQEEIDFESLGVDAEAWGTADGVASIPYAPSHLLPLSSLTTNQSFSSKTSFNPTNTPPIRNVVSMVFLPGFNEPTLALLYAPEPTWAGRLESVSMNYLVSLITLVPSSSKREGSTANETTAVVIATSPPLPHSALSLHPCPPDLGGTLILTANGVLHLEQGGKVVGTPANGWFGKEWLSGTRGGMAPNGEETVREGLEGAHVVFISNSKALVFTRIGTVLQLTLQTSGRAVSSMTLVPVGKGVAASCVERIRGSVGRFGEKGYVFVGSDVGECVLLGWEIGGEERVTAAVVEGADMDLDDDEDLYGTSTTKATVQPQTVVSKRALNLVNCDTIASYGGVRSLAIGLVDDDSPPDLVAATGSGVTSGFTVFHRTLSPRKRRKLLHSEDVATRGLWSIGIEKTTGTPMEYGELSTVDSILVTSTSKGTKTSFQISGLSAPDLNTEDVTLAASAVLQRTAVVRVTSEAVHFFEADLSTECSLPVSLPSTAIRAVILDPWILVVDAKSKVQLFAIDAITRELAVSPLPSVLEAALSSASLFQDVDRLIPLVRTAAAAAALAPNVAIVEDDVEDELYTSSARRPLASDLNLRSDLVVPSEVGRHWVPIVDVAGNLKIYLLPHFEEVFFASAIALLPDVILDGEGGEIPPSVDEDDVEVDRVACFAVGQDRLRPHLVILLTNGQMAVYEAIPSIAAASSSSISRIASLGVRFVKVIVRRLSIPVHRRPKPGEAQSALEPPRRELVPFHHVQGYTGVFMTGEDPLWLLATDHGPARLFDHSEKGVYAFSKAAFEAEEVDFVLQTRTEVAVASLPPNICFDREMPYLRAPRDRKYADITFDIDSGLYVGGALFETVFMNFDEEGKPVFVNDSRDLLEPTNYRSALELILPGTWTAIDGYEFRPNEFVSTVKSVSLATKSTVSGRKDFVAVGTTVYRAEDLAARGGLYLFEVIKIVADPATPTHDHRLKLLTFEDTKSVVGNVCDLDGYIVLSMGQKLYVRAFEQDEVLIAVGFLDVGVHVTSLQAMKNFLLIGDALQSVTLVAFQEDPYKLVLLGRDYRPSRTASANFLVNDGKVAFVVADIVGILRLFEYDPSNIASQAGQRLLCRTEYNAGVEGGATLLFAKHSGNEDVKQNGILYGGVDGSLYILVPVREAVFKRLQLLQTQLGRHVQHFCGLNPRGYRIVKNDSVSRAITKGILDGELLAKFEWLSLDRQVQLTAVMGANVDVDTLQINLRNLSSF